VPRVASGATVATVLMVAHIMLSVPDDRYSVRSS
jgi:hypothetical protein